MEYSYLNSLLTKSMDEHFMDFLNNNNLPKNIKNFQLTWFDEMLEDHEMHKKTKELNKNLNNVTNKLNLLKNKGELNV